MNFVVAAKFGTSVLNIRDGIKPLVLPVASAPASCPARDTLEPSGIVNMRAHHIRYAEADSTSYEHTYVSKHDWLPNICFNALSDYSLHVTGYHEPHAAGSALAEFPPQWRGWRL